jgi:cobalt-zinc-cadmium efflux system membrane fusion protein
MESNMQYTLDKKSTRAVLSVILAGILLGAAILSWKKDGTADVHNEAAGHGEEHKEEHKEESGGHDEAAEGVIALTDDQIRTAGIVTAKAAGGTIGNVLQLPGEVRLNDDRTAHVVPRVPGVAESVPAELGQFVRKGQVLAVISSAALAELRSGALAADRRLELAKLTYQREKKLWEDKISAEQDLLQAQQAYRETEIAAQSARAKLAALEAGGTDGPLNRYVLRAPFDAMVVEKHITQGEALKEDANVFLLSDLSTVWVEVVVAAQDLEAVRIGTPVTVQSTASATSAAGKVSYVGALLGEDTRTAKARVVLANPQLAWRPGLFVNVVMSRGQREAAVAVAADAVQAADGKPTVYVRVAGGFKAQPVRVGATDGTLAEITGGLRPGAVYATAGSFVLKAEQGKGSAEHDH